MHSSFYSGESLSMTNDIDVDIYKQKKPMFTPG